jgi:ABC-type transport system involved in multi-copper enzyme maturation permease subunit
VIWLLRRQYRAALAWAVGLSIVLIATLFALSSSARSDASLLRAHHCTPLSIGNYCSAAAGQFQAHANWSTGLLIVILYVAPAILGILLGVSVVAREFESGTVGLVWLQSLSRTRWIWTKTAFAGSIAASCAILIWLAASIWGNDVYLRFISLSPLTSRVFDTSGVAILGYVAAAYGLGVLAGAMLRRSGVGFTVALGSFGLFRLLVEKILRPAVEGTRFQTLAVQPPYTPSNGLLLHEGYASLGSFRPANGGALTISSVCQPTTQSQSQLANQEFVACLKNHGLHFVVQYVPNSSYWSAQFVEFAVCLIFAIIAIWASKKVLDRTGLEV